MNLTNKQKTFRNAIIQFELSMQFFIICFNGEKSTNLLYSTNLEWISKAVLKGHKLIDILVSLVYKLMYNYIK